MSSKRDSNCALLGRPFRVSVFVVLCSMILVLSSCAHQLKISAYDVPGFWAGVLHGFLILFTFIGSLFSDVRIYAFPNSGSWYDFGYVIGASMFLGGGGAAVS